MAKDKRVPIRMSAEQKEAFEQAALRDGTKNLSAWLRWLAEQRILEVNGGGYPRQPEQEPDPAHAVDASKLAFIPGFGLEEGNP